MTIPSLFVDLDGVLADFDGYFESQFGVRPNQDTYEPPGMWDLIRKHGSFYRDQPPFPNTHQFWLSLLRFHPKPIVLTGVPWSIPNVEAHKREWVNKHLGEDVNLICCKSVDKCKYGRPGDVLIDDRIKYSHHWIQMGGIFVHHTSVENSIQKVASLYPAMRL